MSEYVYFMFLGPDRNTYTALPREIILHSLFMETTNISVTMYSRMYFAFQSNEKKSTQTRIIIMIDRGVELKFGPTIILIAPRSAVASSAPNAIRCAIIPFKWNEVKKRARKKSSTDQKWASLFYFVRCNNNHNIHRIFSSLFVE